jgi:hypothetical protein
MYTSVNIRFFHKRLEHIDFVIYASAKKNSSSRGNSLLPYTFDCYNVANTMVRPTVRKINAIWRMFSQC